MKRKLRVLFYGVTHEHAFGKYMSLSRLPDDFEIVAVADDRARAGAVFLDEKLVPESLPLISEDEARSRSDFDVVFVESANANLMEIAGYWAGHGFPMHCDKPCGETLEPFGRIVATCREGNIPFQIGYMYRGNPAVRFVWDFVRGGGLGHVAFIEADMNHDYGRAGYPEYISSFKGGILYNLGCHLVDLAVPMTHGALRDVRTFRGDAPGDPAGCGTRGAAMLRFDGTDVLLRVSSHMPGGILSRRLRVDGDNGTIDLCPIERFDGEELKLTMSLKEGRGGFPEGRREIDFGVQKDRYAPQLLEFAARVRGEVPNDPAEYERDLLVHELTLKACGLA